MVEAVLSIWESTTRPAAMALLRSAGSDDRWAKLLREFIVASVVRRVVATLDIPEEEREIRGALVAAQVVGLVVTRYLLELEPLASAERAVVIASVGPTVQRYLTGDGAPPVVPGE